MISVTMDEFDPAAIIAASKRDHTGAIVTFLGVVRDDGIECIELIAYEQAAVEELENISREAADRFNLTSVDIIHRLGTLSVGDNIVLIVVGAGHRKAAFLGCEYIIDRIKESVPIWKKEYTGRGFHWVAGEHEGS